MRLLIASPVLPYPPTWGFATRVFHFVRLLARHHAVTVVAYGEPGDTDAIEHLRALGAAVHAVPRATSIGTKRLAQLSSLVSPRSYQWRAMYSPAMQATLREVMARERFDLIQIESSQLAVFEYDARAVLVVDEHNIEYELLYRMFQTESSALRRAYNWIEYQKFRREETRTWRRVSGCVMTSRREEEIVRQHSGATSVITVPNAVDVDYFHPSDPPVENNVVVMTGLMKYRPNVDAAQYFAGEILPRIRAVRPNVVFIVVGGEPADDVRRLAGSHVIVTGSVPDVRPYVDKAAVVVVPLRMGSGTRLKVLEALSMAKPMVSTSVGCEGIDVADGEHLLIRDDAQTFAQGVLDLLEDRSRALNLGAQGRQLVHRKYQWATVVEQLQGFYDSLKPGVLQESPRP